MLTEEALILLATLGASGFLVLGVVELMWPSRPRSSVQRRPRVAASPRGDTTSVVARRLGTAAPSSIAVSRSETPEVTDSPTSVVDPVVDQESPAPEPDLSPVAGETPTAIADHGLATEV